MLKFLLDQRVIQPQYQKWIAKLLGHSFEVVYKPGAENRAADALSRKPAEIQLYGLSIPVIVDLEVIKKEVNQDPKFQKIIVELKRLDNPTKSKYSLQNEMLKYKERLVITKSSSLIPAILDTFHNSVVGRHSGFLRTYKRVSNELYWDGMKASIKKHYEECLICQRNKTLALSPAGLLVPLEIPQAIWSDISMDFVEGLPKVGGFEVILVVVDWLSKYGHFLPLKHPFTVNLVAEIFVKEVVRLHGFPLSIVSDRDKIFLSLFWTELFRLSGTKLNKSTVYHPQSDGQTEVVNKGVETYLRCFCSEKPKEWVKWLPWTEYWQVTLGRKRNEKLSPRFFDPYKVLEKVGYVAYRLELPANTTIHPLFHVSQLRKLVGQHKNLQPTIQYVNENYEWKSVPEEAIAYRKTVAGQWEVLIRYEGLPQHEATWESYEEMHCSYLALHLEDKVNLEGGSNVRPPIKYV
ncbi:transposon Tf2-1 polyprotein isoform X1 [Cucumis melo var. makuwa]|uniref:Transposon Tf2-1 polyprotein isoform X1 n=1 Tax=Cucumis melo var. makuwa TaxID=1194695 RepID=A0A5A7TPT9_CUCMM|nr:transposon Tf2-1 polyprotein isoform X1 [Cucumis melo var. makuwa]TYK29303.1 transposon Tf2-1 polyprotein isoform X1 [Cucumis melo var. makuwa]